MTSKTFLLMISMILVGFTAVGMAAAYLMVSPAGVESVGLPAVSENTEVLPTEEPQIETGTGLPVPMETEANLESLEDGNSVEGVVIPYNGEDFELEGDPFF